MASSKDKWVRRFFIAETGHHKQGFTIYKVTSLIFLKKSPDTASKVSVWKRYNDFKKLYKSLEALNKSSLIKEPFPPFAKPKFFGRFEKEVVNERRKCAIKLLEFIAKHSVLYTSDAFVKFFESNIDLDDNSYNCAQSITSYDTSSEDDCDINDDSNNNRKCVKPQNTSDILFNSSGIQNIITEKHSISTRQQMISSECTKQNSITLNLDVQSLKIENNRSKNVECGDKQMKDCIISNDTPLLKTDTTDYIIVAAAHMSAGHQHKLLGEYEEAYLQYKYGINHLEHGVKVDTDSTRQIRVLEKIQKYTGRTEKFYKKYLYNNSSILSKPAMELAHYKILRIIGPVMLVKDTRFLDVKRIIKTIEKCAADKHDIFRYILRQKVPFMVDLHAYVQTESTIFLILGYVCGGSLWTFIKSHYGFKEIKLHNSDINTLTATSCELSKISNGESDVCINISTNQLMEQSQELLKSVDETLKKSNSIIIKDKNLLTISKKVNNTLKTCNPCNKTNGDTFKLFSTLEETNHSSSENAKISNVSNIYDSHNDTLWKDINETQVETSTIFNDCFQVESTNDENIEVDRKYWQLPNAVSRRWAAQLLLALEALHQQNAIISNLRPSDLLVDQNGDIILSYVIPRHSNEFANVQFPYAAPELFLYLPHIFINESVDIWSFGVILYELITGILFQARHPRLIRSHSVISIPHQVPENAKDLLIDILKFEPSERLTVQQIKNHRYFENVDWKNLLRS